MQESAAGALARTVLLKSMETSTQHFAEDPEALEEFVLGRSDPATRARYEGHLRSCETCRQAVHVERIIAAGIKRAGRDHLKERIRTLLGIPLPRRIPWPHVVSIAAVLAILIGIGITQRWFVTHVAPKEVLTSENVPQDQKSVGTSQQLQNQQETNSQPAARATPAKPEQHSTGHGGVTQESNETKSIENQKYAEGLADRLEEAPAVAGKDMRRADSPQSPTVAGGAGPEFWANGTLITETSAKKETDAGNLAKMKSVDQATAADESRGKTDSIGPVVIEQRPASKLPSMLQSQQQFYGRRTIQTLVRQSGGETQLTLYPEVPFDSTQLHYARLQQVTPDSLILRIGNQQIGYRLPVGALRQTEQSKPAK
jgi:hypothetical protein